MHLSNQPCDILIGTPALHPNPLISMPADQRTQNQVDLFLGARGDLFCVALIPAFSSPWASFIALNQPRDAQQPPSVRRRDPDDDANFRRCRWARGRKRERCRCMKVEDKKPTRVWTSLRFRQKQTNRVAFTEGETLLWVVYRK